LGINCVALESVTPALKQLQALTDKPLVVYPNSGEQYDASSKTWHSAPSGCTLHDKLPEWQHAGARLIGGCCRTSPKDIAAIAHRVNRNKAAESGDDSAIETREKAGRAV
jgi:homocysteine S-methyltransferase